MVNWIQILFARLIGIEVSVLAELCEVYLGILSLILYKEPEYIAFSIALFAQELISRRSEIFVIGEEEQVLSRHGRKSTIIIET